MSDILVSQKSMIDAELQTCAKKLMDLNLFLEKCESEYIKNLYIGELEKLTMQFENLGAHLSEINKELERISPIVQANKLISEVLTEDTSRKRERENDFIPPVKKQRENRIKYLDNFDYLPLKKVVLKGKTVAVLSKSNDEYNHASNDTKVKIIRYTSYDIQEYYMKYFYKELSSSRLESIFKKYDEIIILIPNVFFHYNYISEETNRECTVRINLHSIFTKDHRQCVRFHNDIKDYFERKGYFFKFDSLDTKIKLSITPW